MNKIKLNIGSFDLIKGFAMIVIIIGHINGTIIWQSHPFLIALFAGCYRIRAAIIPIFLIVSGYGFKVKSPQKTFRTTFSKLIIPYLYITFALLLLYPFSAYLRYRDWNDSIHATFRLVLTFLLGNTESGKVVLGYTLSWCSASWYLLASFIALNILNLILKIKNKVLQPVFVVACAIAGYQILNHGFTYFCLSQGLMAVGFCYIGYLIKKYKLIEKCIRNAWTYVILIPIAMAQATWGDFDLRLGAFNNVIRDYFGAGCFAILLILIGVYLGSHDWKSLDWLKEIGVHSYWIVILHSFELMYFHWWKFKEILPDNQPVALLLQIVLKALFISGGCKIIKEILRYKYSRMGLSI